MVSTNASKRIQIPTGIPPHVEMMTKIQELTNLIKIEREERKRHYEEIKISVGDKLEELAVTHGHITRPAVEKLFEDFSATFKTRISEKIDNVVENVLASTTGDARRNSNHLALEEQTELEMAQILRHSLMNKKILK